MSVDDESNSSRSRRRRRRPPRAIFNGDVVLLPTDDDEEDEDVDRGARLNFEIFLAEFALAKCMLYTGIGWREDAKTWIDVCRSVASNGLIRLPHWLEDGDEDEDVIAKKIFEIAGSIETKNRPAEYDGDEPIACDEKDECTYRRRRRLYAVAANAHMFYLMTTGPRENRESRDALAVAVSHRWLDAGIDAVAIRDGSNVFSTFVETMLAELTARSAIAPSEALTDAICFARNACDAWNMCDLGRGAHATAFAAVVTADAKRLCERTNVAMDPRAAAELSLGIEKWKTNALREALDVAEQRNRVLANLLDAAMSPSVGTISLVRPPPTQGSLGPMTSHLLLFHEDAEERSLAHSPVENDPDEIRKMTLEVPIDVSLGAISPPPQSSSDDPEPAAAVVAERSLRRTSSSSIARRALCGFVRTTIDGVLEKLSRLDKGRFEEEVEAPFARPSDADFARDAIAVADVIADGGDASDEETSRAIRCVSRMLGWINWRQTLSPSSSSSAVSIAKEELLRLVEELYGALSEMTGSDSDGVAPLTRRAMMHLKNAIRQCGGVMRRRRRIKTREIRRSRPSHRE